MSRGRITVAIRDAIINRDDRDGQLDWIMSTVICDRNKAKELYFAFIYRAEEDFLVHILQRGESDE